MVAVAHIGIVGTPTTFHPSHEHDSWELVLYTSGTGTITVGSTAVPFDIGTIVCLPPLIPHFETSAGGYTNIFMIFSQFKTLRTEIPTFTDDAQRSFFHLSMQLYKEFNLRQSGWKPICDHLAELLGRYLERWSSATVIPEVEQLRHLLLENLHRPGYSVGDAMAMLGCSPDHARRLFLKATGTAPTTYLAQLRISSAKRLLAEGALVREVAEQVGLPDAYYFSRVFRRHAGMSPSEYLASLRS